MIKIFVLLARQYNYTWKQIASGLKDDGNYLFEFLQNKVNKMFWTEKVLLPNVYKTIVNQIRMEVEENDK